MKTALTWLLLIQGLLGAWLLAVYARGELHSGPFVALVLLQGAFFLLFLACFLSTFIRRTLKEPAWPRLLAFLGLVLETPAVCILAMWGVQALTD